MMYCTENAQQYTQGGTVASLGYFDGVHLGHRSVIMPAVIRAKEQGLKSAVFTFTLQSAGTAGKGLNILSQKEKAKRIEQLGVDIMYCPPFESFNALSPQQFADEILVKRLNARAVYCGENFTFGAKKSGDTELLKVICKDRGIELHVEKLKNLGDDTVSSTRIRKALQSGDVAAVHMLMGVPYCVDAPVVRGRGNGKGLGYPTANQIFAQGMARPKDGVYITKTTYDGAEYHSVTGIGERPTLHDKGVTCETHIIGFDKKDLYGSDIKVSFYSRIADTVEFSSLEELSQAIKKYAKQSIDYFNAL